MTNIIKIKRRASGGAAGAPAALKGGELAYNEADNTLYYGAGDDGGGNATSIFSVAGPGTFAKLASPSFTGTPTAPTAATVTNTTQIATTAFVQAVAAAKASDYAPASHTHAISEVTGLQAALDGKSATGHGHVIGDVTGLQTALDGKSNTGHGHTIADVTSLQSTLNAKAPLASPALTGTPTAPTAVGGTSTTQIATTAFVQAAVSALIDAAPGALDTLNELAAALGDDPNFATTVTNSLNLKAPLASPALTGSPTAPTPTAGNNSTLLATTAFVTNHVANAALDGGTF